MSITISETCRIYDVTIDNYNIETLVTSDAVVLNNWIRQTESSIVNNDGYHTVVIGLDIEWRPTFTSTSNRNPVAIIQLCFENRCLVFQIHQHFNNNPQNDGRQLTQLYGFLNHPGLKFVGVGIEADVEKLVTDYGLHVGNVVDLRGVAATETGNEWMRNEAGMKSLAEYVLGLHMEKPTRVRTGDWDRAVLSLEQVKYAVADAYVSYKLGTVLGAYRYGDY